MHQPLLDQELLAIATELHIRLKEERENPEQGAHITARVENLENLLTRIYQQLYYDDAQIQEALGKFDDDFDCESCPGCGRKAGEENETDDEYGLTPDCTHPEGCGFFRWQEQDGPEDASAEQFVRANG
jgi:hypothetical protein